MIMSLLLTLMALTFFTCGRGESARLEVMTKAVQNIFENGLLLLFSGSPVASVRNALEELRECVSRSYEEEIGTCVVGPARTVATSWLILTDFRTWLWPPDVDVADEVHLEVLMRRLKPTVRRDQCGKSDKPS